FSRARSSGFCRADPSPSAWAREPRQSDRNRRATRRRAGTDARSRGRLASPARSFLQWPRRWRRARRPVPRVDEPQGFAKKIEVHLLLADLALEFGNPRLRLRQFGQRSRRSRRSGRTGASPARLTSALPVQPGYPKLAMGRPPLVKQLAPDLQLVRNRRYPLPSLEPKNHRLLELCRKCAHPLL